MRKYTLYIIITTMLFLGNNIEVSAQFGSDLGSEAISTLAWDHIRSQSNASKSAGSIGLTTDNRMYVWGGNFAYTIHSQSERTLAGADAEPQYQTVPYYVPSPAGETIKKVRIMSPYYTSAGNYIPTYLALSQSGKLYAWGANSGLLKTQWPIQTSYVINDTTKTRRTPILLTVLPENTFVDFEVSTYGNYWIAISSTGKAYHIGNAGGAPITITTDFTALPNPAGVDAATFKYTNVWLYQNSYSSTLPPSVYLKGNNGKIYFTGSYNTAYGCGVPSIVPYANTSISYPQRFWSTSGNEGSGRILTYPPIEVPFPAGEDIIDMDLGLINSGNYTANAFAISAGGKGYMAGLWRSKRTSNPATDQVQHYTIAPLKSVPASADLLRAFTFTNDSVFVLTRFTEIAIPTGATKVVDIQNLNTGLGSYGSLAVFDNNRVYWSGRSERDINRVLMSGNYLSLDSKTPNDIPGKCFDVGNAVSNSNYSWTYEAINFKGAVKLSKVETSGGGDGLFIISKIGRGYFVGIESANAGLGKRADGTSGLQNRVFEPVPIANEQLLDCQTSSGTGGPLAPVTPPSNTAVGTIDCSKTQLSPAPTVGTATQLDLIVSINVTTAGTFTPITVSGSGMSVANDITSVTTTTTGIQTFHIPMHYDGTALGMLNFTIGSAGSCSADLSGTTKIKVINEVWTLDNCTLQTIAPDLK